MNIKRQDCTQKVCVSSFSSIWIGWMDDEKEKKLNLLLVKVRDRDRNTIRMASPSLCIYRRKKMRRDEEKSWSRKCILLTLQLSLSIYLSYFFLFVIYPSREEEKSYFFPFSRRKYLDWVLRISNKDYTWLHWMLNAKVEKTDPVNREVLLLDVDIKFLCLLLIFLTFNQKYDE